MATIARGQVTLSVIEDGKYTTSQWAISNSERIAPTAGWSNAPTLAAKGEYLWQRTGVVVPPLTLPTAWSVPFRVTGETGATGESITGMMLYRDPEFRKGENGCRVYNNLVNGSVTISLISRPTDCPTTSPNCLKIKTVGDASPFRGGFYQLQNARANAVFIQKIIAKIPVGYTIWGEKNAMGDGVSDQFITSVAGTGKYETYIRKTICGSTGAFSSGGHVYLRGGSLPTPTAPLEWYVASCTSYDVTDTEKYDDSIAGAVEAAQVAQMAIDEMNNDNVFDVAEKQTIRTQWERISGVDKANGSYSEFGSYGKTLALAGGNVPINNLTKCFTDLYKNLSANELYVNTNLTPFYRKNVAKLFAIYFNEEVDIINKIGKKYVDNKRLGTTNLVVNSIVNETIKPAAYQFATRRFSNGKPLEYGKTYTVVANGRVDQQALDDGKALDVYLDGYQRILRITSTVDATHTATFVCNQEIESRRNNITSYLTPYGGSRLGKATLNWYALYEGDMAPMDWSACPDDTLIAIENVNTAVGNLNTYVDGAFSDGIIASSEAQAIATYVNKINEAKATADSSYTSVYENTLLSGVKKTDLANAKNVLDTARNALLASVNTAITDGKTTPAEKQDVDQKYTTYNRAYGIFTTHLEAASDMIVKANADKAVEDIVLGTTNLVVNSMVKETSSIYGFANRRFSKGKALENGKTYTLVVNGRIDQQALTDGKTLAVWIGWDQFLLQTNSLTDKTCSVTFVCNVAEEAQRTSLNAYLYPADGSRLGKATLNWYALYEGDKAPMDWSACPDDTNYLTEAITSDASIKGGLINSSLMLLGSGKGDSREIRSGIDGTSSNVGAFFGGTYEDAIADSVIPFSSPQARATGSLIKKDGSFHFAKGKIRGDINGEAKIGGFSLYNGSIISDDGKMQFSNISSKDLSLSLTNYSIANKSKNRANSAYRNGDDTINKTYDKTPWFSDEIQLAKGVYKLSYDGNSSVLYSWCSLVPNLPNIPYEYIERIEWSVVGSGSVTGISDANMTLGKQEFAYDPQGTASGSNQKNYSVQKSIVIVVNSDYATIRVASSLLSLDMWENNNLGYCKIGGIESYINLDTSISISNITLTPVSQITAVCNDGMIIARNGDNVFDCHNDTEIVAGVPKEYTALKFKGRIDTSSNIPMLICGGEVEFDGNIKSVMGSKQFEINKQQGSNGIYTIGHRLNIANYMVTATVIGTDAYAIIYIKDVNAFQIRTINRNGLINANFSFMMYSTQLV